MKAGLQFLNAHSSGGDQNRVADFKNLSQNDRQICVYQIFNWDVMLKPWVRTITGLVIVNFAAGIMNDWGVISLYIISYFHYHPSPMEMNSSSNSKLLLMLMVPMIICLFVSPKLASCLGHQRLLRISSIFFIIPPIAIFITFNFYSLVIACLIIPCIAYSVSLVSMFHCLYSQFPNNKSKATGVAIFSLGAGTIFWNFVATLTINPDNVIPDVSGNDPEIKFFPQDIADRLVLLCKIIFSISAVVYPLGLWLINCDVDQPQNVPSNIAQEQQYQQPQQMQVQQIQLIQIQQPHQQEDEQISAHSQQDALILTNILQYLGTKIFILLFTLSAIGSMFQFQVQFYAKLIYMPIVEDDHLISIGLIVLVVMGAAMSILWGYLGDKFGPGVTILIYVFADFVIKILSCFVQNKPEYIASMVLLGATDKTMMVLFAPTLIDKFGLAVATNLLPFKGLSAILGMVFPIVLRLIFNKWSDQTFLLFLCGLGVINIIAGIVIYFDLRQSQTNPDEPPIEEHGQNKQQIQQQQQIKSTIISE